MQDFVSFATGEDATKHRTAVELITRRMNRDRVIQSLEIDSNGDARAILDDGTEVLTAVSLRDAAPEVQETMRRLLESSSTDDPELLLLVRRSQRVADPADDPLYKFAAATELPKGRLFFGVFYPDQTSDYRAYRRIDGEWAEDISHRSFSPLFYRELRVHRLANFNLTILHKSDSVYVVSAVARNNPRDERLFALVSAADAEPEIDEDGTLVRIPKFEQSFMEAVYKMRSEQAKRPRRLFWNRIVVHTWALMGMRARQIKDYGMRLVPRTRDLGLERVVIYTRRKRWSEDVVRELELLFLNISEDQFTLRSRSPSDQPLTPMDQYVSNVVRSRQRKTVYPYEILKLITFAGYPVTTSAPRGEFEEYDISVDEDSGEQRAYSVAEREYGANRSNVIFGVITNKDPVTKQSFRRVIILSDSTKDMGSLAEHECRRVIAALDLAEERGVPAEWLPISSGARIDLESGTENLDWTAATLRRIVEFTQAGGEINIIVAGINVGAQSYWNAEATMLMHTRGLLIMTDDASMLLTGKKALDFSGSVSADTNQDIGGVEKIMGPNGQAQIAVTSLGDAYSVLFRHYRYTYKQPGASFPKRLEVADTSDRDVGRSAYHDRLGQGFNTVGDIFSSEHNPDRKKPFEMRQVMAALIDRELGYLERWQIMRDAETAIVWETRLGGFSVGMIGIESRSLARLGEVPHDGPEAWSGGTLFPLSSKKVARGINAFSNRVPLVILANLSGFDGSPESLRKLQLEYGAEIGRAIVNFEGPICFVVVGRYHGGAYVVFSKTLNKNLQVAALEGSFASVLGGAPAAAVVFPRQVAKQTLADERIVEAQKRLASDDGINQHEYEELYQKVYSEKQTAFGQKFDRIHNVERAKEVGSLHDIITITELRPYLIARLEDMTKPQR
jgi:acetyl-CoA carboxylase carboxyltransferase component